MKKKTFYGTQGPYLTVYCWFKFKLFRVVSICFHYFHRPAEDPDCHDHPFHFFTLVLWGGYFEEFPDGTVRHMKWTSFGFRRARFLHRIRFVERNTWTLCIKISPKIPRLWGFATKDGWVWWKDYIKAKGLEPVNGDIVE